MQNKHQLVLCKKLSTTSIVCQRKKTISCLVVDIVPLFFVWISFKFIALCIWGTRQGKNQPSSWTAWCQHHQSREDHIDQKNKLTHSRLIQHCLFANSCYRLGTIPCTTPSVKLELRIQEPCCKMWQRVQNESRLYQLHINVRACFSIFGHTKNQNFIDF